MYDLDRICSVQVVLNSCVSSVSVLSNANCFLIVPRVVSVRDLARQRDCESGLGLRVVQRRLIPSRRLLSVWGLRLQGPSVTASGLGLL